MKIHAINSHARKYTNLDSSSSKRMYVKIVVMTMLIILVTAVFCLCFFLSPSITTSAYAQGNYGLKTFESRDLVIDLGNGLKTEAQLTLPLIGEGPFPGVLLVHGSGVADKDYYVNSKIAPFKQISQYLSERGFAVLKYDKRGVGPNFTVADANVWGNVTFDDLKQDAERALDVLVKQPEVDPNKITIIGHSEGTTITPRVAIDNPSKVKNIVLMGAAANNTRDLVYFREVTVPLLYAQKVLDRNNTGLISISEGIVDPIFNFLTRNFTMLLNTLTTNETNMQLNSHKQQNNAIEDGYMSITNELKQKLIEQAKALSTIIPGKKCIETGGCPVWLNSQYVLQPNMDIIGNVPHSISILILQGGNDTATPLQQAFLLQQALIDAKHPDHTLITYPNLGHGFHRQSEWMPVLEGIQSYVLADLFSWLADHSGFSGNATVINFNASSMEPTFKNSSSSNNTNDQLI